MSEDAEGRGKLFPIGELSARTQVNTVTLRAWERRYGLLKPARSEKGHRLYCDDDVSTIEKILALVARGVSIGKVKPLLVNDESVAVEDAVDSWQGGINELVDAVKLFSVSKVEHVIQQSFASYPASTCRERLIEPVFSRLSQAGDLAASGFMESELIRYTLVRLSAKLGKKKSSHQVTLIVGNQTPIWCLALMALELVDANVSVHLFARNFSVETGLTLAKKFESTVTVFYQDGIWKDKERQFAAAAQIDNDQLLLCGTAPKLAELDEQGRVFAELKSCVGSLIVSDAEAGSA